jgi:regulator of protease activity HflC (stomatin/prohibitin superfamily)
MIRRQMRLEVEQAVRSVVANVADPTDVARTRDTHAQAARDRLQASVSRWGISVLDLRFLDVVIASDRIRAANRDVLIERERQDAQRLAELRAQEVALVGEAHARATARMVEELVRTIKAQGTPLNGDEIERIVITAMQRVSDQQQLSGFFRDVSQGASTGSTARLPEPPTNPTH